MNNLKKEEISKKLKDVVENYIYTDGEYYSTLEELTNNDEEKIDDINFELAQAEKDIQAMPCDPEGATFEQMEEYEKREEEAIERILKILDK